MMTEETPQVNKPNDDKSIPTYERLSEIKPPRSDVALAESNKDDELGEHKGGLAQRTKFAPKLTDFQVVDKRLFPILKDTLEWLNNLMVGRVFPEEIIPLKNIIVKHLLGEYPEISFAEAYCIAEVAVTVPLDSEGRIDITRIFAKAGEAEEEKEKNKI